MIRRLLLLLLFAALVLLGRGYWNAIQDPQVRMARIHFPDWPAGAPPVRVVLISDLHVAGPDMPPTRLARIVKQVNALHPDLVLVAGDLVSDKEFATRHYDDAEAVAPLAGLSAPLGTIAVLGNHDHKRGADGMREALAAIGVPVLDNEAVRRGPLTIAGADDPTTAHGRPRELAKSAASLPEPSILLVHAPGFATRLDLDPRFRLILAGHTHCGQIVLPQLGAIAHYFSPKPAPLPCGLVNLDGRTTVVTSGLGTSIVPLRYGAPPDLWLLSLGPVPATR